MACAPKNVSVSSLKVTWVDLIKDTYTAFIIYDRMSNLQTATINMNSKLTSKE